MCHNKNQHTSQNYVLQPKAIIYRFFHQHFLKQSVKKSNAMVFWATTCVKQSENVAPKTKQALLSSDVYLMCKDHLNEINVPG